MKILSVTGVVMSLVSLAGITLLYFTDLQRMASTTFVLTFGACIFSAIFSFFVLIRTNEKHRRRHPRYTPSFFSSNF